MHELVSEAQGTTRRAIELSEHIARLLTARTGEKDQAITIAERSQEQVEKLLTFVANRDHKYLEARYTLGKLLLGRESKLDPERPLDPDELKAFSQLLPQWKIKVKISDGEVRKVFSRQITPLELEEERLETEGVEGPKVHDTYKAFCDPEHFDYKLASFFGTYSGSGTLDGRGTYDFTIIAPEKDLIPAITWSDFSATVQAEVYLQENYLRSTETAGATVELA